MNENPLRLIIQSNIQVDTQGLGWTESKTGISQISVKSIGDCPGCSTKEEIDQTYLLSGCEGSRYLTGSLFDPDRGAGEKHVVGKMTHVEQRSWEAHMEDVTETSLLERTAALAVDYVYSVELPEDWTSENMSEVGSDLENSNLPERALCRVVSQLFSWEPAL